MFLCLQFSDVLDQNVSVVGQMGDFFKKLDLQTVTTISPANYTEDIAPNHAQVPPYIITDL